MDNFFRRVWILVFIGLGVLIIWWARGALLSAGTLLLAGLTFGYLCSPVALFLEKRKVKPAFAAILAVLCGIVAVALFLVLAVPVIFRQAQALLLSLPQYLDVVATLLATLNAWLLDRGIIETAFTIDIAAQTQQIAQGIMRWSGTMVRVVPNGLARAILTPVIGFYFIKDRKWFIDRILHIVPLRRRHIAVNAGRAIHEVLRHYIGGQITVAAITGALTGIAFMLLGVEGFVVLGILMALCDLIPVVGPWLGAVPALAVAASGGLWLVALVGATIFLIQQLENTIISPRIVGSRAGLHPVVVISALFVGGGLLGVAGMFFSIPFVLVVRSVVRAVRQDRLYPEERK